MRPFDYARARDAADAIQRGSASDARFVAGGTNLIDLMKLEVETPAHVVDVNALPGAEPALAQISDLPGGGLRIGALARMSDTAWDSRVRERYPVLSQSLLLAASGQLRNMASIGGNILQRTRCWYFRDTAMPCNKREPGTGCSALHGINRMHAVLGTSEHCIATHPSDMCVALAALEAKVHLTGPAGHRTLPFSDFHRLPGHTPERDTNLEANEIITAIELPSRGFAESYSYLKIRDRLSYAFALVSVAAALELEGGTIREARLALGGVAHRPWRHPDAERALRGQAANEVNFARAADLLLQGARSYSHNAFKVGLARRAIVRALAQAAHRTPQSQSNKKIA